MFYTIHKNKNVFKKRTFSKSFPTVQIKLDIIEETSQLTPLYKLN